MNSAMGIHEIAACILIRAELARRLSTVVLEGTTAAALSDIARELHQEATKIEENAVGTTLGSLA
jgi:hypothetical protein